MKKLFIVLLIVLGITALGTTLTWNATQRDTEDSVQLTGPIRYNCELSAGTFNDGRCNCPAEEEYVETGGGSAYDKKTGYCQTAHGGPSGDAFNASVGLPWGDFSFWIGIVGNHCTESGGSWLNARCTCPDGATYDRSSGICK
jgi:hypothetical protein